jgi:hypothetical protein
MGIKQGVKQAALFAAVALTASAPSQANDFFNGPQLTSPGSMVYVSIPLGGASAKERMPSYGLALQGRRQYERLVVDNRLFNAFEGGVILGIEAKWLVVGAVVVGAGAYALQKDDDRSSSYSGSQNNQQKGNPPPPPADCPQQDPCK